MKLNFHLAPRPAHIPENDWKDWTWQLRHSLKRAEDFSRYLTLTEDEKRAFEAGAQIFRFRTTPYYISLVEPTDFEAPLRRIQVPRLEECHPGLQQMDDPLGEKRHNPAPRVIHRYPDRVLLLVTDTCSVYCRYCTRKHFTATDQATIKLEELGAALKYIKSHPEIREVIFSGGDPLVLGDEMLNKILSEVRSIEHVEIIRLGSRMPVVCPMRVTDGLVSVLKKYQPLFLMTHFNHPREVTADAAQALGRFVDNGIPVFNQMVLLNGVNNHPAIVKALSRRLLYLRVKPYYMFQCDPSLGTDHLRTSVEQSEEIQRALWGRMSGLAMPNLSLDIPNGGGKVGITPRYEIGRDGNRRTYRGWDGVVADYVSPEEQPLCPTDAGLYEREP